jgi:hypothetical protein
MQTLRWLRENWLQAAILAIPFIVVAAFWDRFPGRVVVALGPRRAAERLGRKVPGALRLPRDQRRARDLSTAGYRGLTRGCAGTPTETGGRSRSSACPQQPSARSAVS